MSNLTLKLTRLFQAIFGLTKQNTVGSEPP